MLGGCGPGGRSEHTAEPVDEPVPVSAEAPAEAGATTPEPEESKSAADGAADDATSPTERVEPYPLSTVTGHAKVDTVLAMIAANDLAGLFDRIRMTPVACERNLSHWGPSCRGADPGTLIPVFFNAGTCDGGVLTSAAGARSAIAFQLMREWALYTVIDFDESGSWVVLVDVERIPDGITVALDGDGFITALHGTCANVANTLSAPGQFLLDPPMLRVPSPSREGEIVLDADPEPPPYPENPPEPTPYELAWAPREGAQRLLRALDRLWGPPIDCGGSCAYVAELLEVNPCLTKVGPEGYDDALAGPDAAEARAFIELYRSACGLVAELAEVDRADAAAVQARINEAYAALAAELGEPD